MGLLLDPKLVLLTGTSISQLGIKGRRIRNIVRWALSLGVQAVAEFDVYEGSYCVATGMLKIV
jgi:hypothetical protein